MQPEFEAGLELIRQSLLVLDADNAEISRETDKVRQELYAPLYATDSEEG